MSSTAWDLPGTDGGGAAARLRAALATIRAGVDETLSTPTTSVEAAQLGHVLTFAAHRRTLAAGALWDAGFTDLEGGDPIRWITQRA